MSPRPFERPATIAVPEAPGLAPGSTLEGLWLPPRGERSEERAAGDDDANEPVIARGGAVVAPPHPLMGGSLESPVATEIALALSDSGWSALRFNWRGVGASAGAPSGEVDDADADYRAALEFMSESVDGPIVACGYSWGALAAARMGPLDNRVRRLVLIAPPPAMLDAKALAGWGHPILVIAGDRDDYVPEDELRTTLDPVENAEYTILEGVDHFFMSGLAQVGQSIRSALAPN